jgi:drug/metabolite transporter (DMT)-like permease
MPYWVWIPLLIVLYVVSANFTVWANDKENPDGWKWVAALYFLNLCGLWPLVARYSRALVMDSLIYDLILFFTFYFTLVYLGAAERFNGWQWAGCVAVIMGFVLMKIGEFL